jgi:ribosomal-protein-alanine N-acetyltransferase
MSSKVFIRKALPSEADSLAELAYAAWERDLLPFLHGPAASRGAERQRLAHVVGEGSDRIIVAETGGRPVGWCQRMAGRPYVPFLFVAPAAQNHGIGRALLRRMESILELEGYDRVVLDTLADNVRAVNFYQHQGYHILAFKTEGRPGRDPQQSVRLEKRLDPWRGPIDDIG